MATIKDLLILPVTFKTTAYYIFNIGQGSNLYKNINIQTICLKSYNIAIRLM